MYVCVCKCATYNDANQRMTYIYCSKTFLFLEFLFYFTFFLYFGLLFLNLLGGFVHDHDRFINVNYCHDFLFVVQNS